MIVNDSRPPIFIKRVILYYIILSCVSSLNHYIKHPIEFFFKHVFILFVNTLAVHGFTDLPSAVPDLCSCSVKTPSGAHGSQPAVGSWGPGWGCSAERQSAHTHTGSPRISRRWRDADLPHFEHIVCLFHCLTSS